MYLTCITQCMPTSTETMLLLRGLPSNFLKSKHVFLIWYEFLYVNYSKFFIMIRFFKEASVEEREHAEKFMEYQVLFRFIYKIAHTISSFNSHPIPCISLPPIVYRIREVEKLSCRG